MTKTVTGIQYWFYGSKVTPVDVTSKDGNGNATVTSNWNIRSLPNRAKSVSKITVVANATQVILAIPANKRLTKVTSKNQFGSEITANFTDHMTELNLGGGDSKSDTIGSHTKPYKVYVYTISAPVPDADEYTITVGNA